MGTAVTEASIVISYRWVIRSAHREHGWLGYVASGATTMDARQEGGRIKCLTVDTMAHVYGEREREREGKRRAAALANVSRSMPAHVVICEAKYLTTL